MISYTYLDDESVDAVGPYVDAVSDAIAGLVIYHLHPLAHSNQLQTCRERERAGQLDGLILDLRLDQKVNNGIRADYRATTLAQEIRTRATEGNMGEYPIVLWSTDEKLNKSYAKDDTSHDLFDLKAVKGDILEPDKAIKLARKLVALVNGYGGLKKIRAVARKQIYRFLGFDAEPDFLDLRILSSIDDRNGVLPIHEYARFIIKELLELPGPLIDENIVAARLGINLIESPDFYLLLNKSFKSAIYSGPFSSGWPRWWSALIDEAWRRLPKCPGNLRILSATDRVNFLKKATGLKRIVAASSDISTHQTTFWTICQATLKPLDPKDGFLIDRQPAYSWQDKLYVSLSALLEGIAEEKRIRIDPLEKHRFTRAKNRLNRE